MSGRRKCVGILREVKYKWERRAPLAPAQVRKLVDSGVQVLVQPSDRRIFTNGEYAAAGAIITEDISAANTIFGVKEVRPESLIPGKTYVIFSHVIKAQPYNMPLLDTAVRRGVRLVDYECIRANGTDGRVVAFGRFAGIAGMVDYLRGLGERLLTMGYSTPFMGVANSFMYPSVSAARAAVAEVGNEIERVGLPEGISPLSFTFTGSGNVTRGAREIFDLLPHQLVSAPELAEAYPRGLMPGDAAAEDRHRVLGCMARLPDLVQPVGAEPGERADIDRAHYYEHPSAYRPVFHERVAPFTGALINGMYWDSRFPRLLTNEQGRALAAPGGSRTPSGFLGVSDITCDVGGSVEFLTTSTDLESPFFIYNPDTGASTPGLSGDGFLMQGVDILPAQFPRDATEHFSAALEPFVEALSLPAADGDRLPAEIANAVITGKGVLQPSYEYISQLRETTERAAASEAAASQEAAAAAGGVDTRARSSLLLKGHLFDSGFINKTLDLAEHAGAECQFTQWVIGHSVESSSRCVISVRHEDAAELEEVVSRVRQLVDLLPAARATVEKLPEGAERSAAGKGSDVAGPVTFGAHAAKASGDEGSAGAGVGAAAASVAATGDRVLVLGSGFVAAPVVDYLASRGHEVVVGSAAAEQAQRLVRGVANATAVPLDAADTEAVREQVRRAKVVVSLLPATMHVPVAKMCIEHGVHLVTASYTSPEMRALDGAAREAGVSLINEVGLDPGLDHMSAMEIVNDVSARGGRVTSFESLCGGLPAPEAADNPLGYKFSWNPRGVLTASQNSAVFLEHGAVHHVDGADLLRSARPLKVLPSLSLEYLPNRNSLSYLDTYGLGREAEPEAGPMRTMFRGTIRYGGFSSIMSCFASLGLLNPEARVPDAATNWAAAMAAITGGGAGGFRDTLRRAGKFGDEEIERAADAASWLGLLSPDAQVEGGRPLIDAFCQVLEDRLAYAPGERDMVLMHHRFEVDGGDGGAGQELTSTMMAYGNDRYSAMALTVGLPTAVAAQMVLDGRAERRGALVPVTADLYAPILAEMPGNGIVFKEASRPLR